VPKAAAILKPLTDALRGSVRGPQLVAWSTPRLAAFSAAKAALAAACRLDFPAHGAELSLVTDASASHAGAVLQQRRRGQQWRPLGFFSVRLDSPQQKYSAFNRELLAVFLAIRHFRFMLEGRQFVVFTDHRPLLGVLGWISEPWSARQQRQLSYMAEFTVDIRHIAGQSNIVADTLSRPAAAQADTSSHTAGLAAAAFEAVHNLAHPGIRATWRLISSRYVWPNLAADVKKWCQDCSPCQIAKVTRQPAAAVHSILVPATRFSHLHLDLAGPLSAAADGSSHILTVVDRSTRWAKAALLWSTSAAVCLEALAAAWFARYGIPATITTDRVSQFTSG
jgi:RNase H-like domain found in reverse transcriptase/Integrase zinc binding domain